MGRALALAVALAALVTLLMGRADGAPEGGAAACIVTAELDGIVGAASAAYLENALEHAEAECGALLVRIDTPGGSLEATRHIARLFLGAEVPVIAYVAPSGARAGSAGMFVVMAAHVAAMAPGSNIGAAHPVLAGGGDPEQAGGEELARKIENDVAAFARAVAGARGRNAEWAEDAVRESLSATAAEALELGVIDRVAGSQRELLAALDGTAIALGPDRTVTLRTAGLPLVPWEMTLQQRVLSLLSNPTLVMALAMIGLLAIFVELSNPGLVVPGIVGGVCLLLAAIGMDVLPVRAGAIALLVLGALLLVAEVFVTSYGALGLAGLGALLLGAALLVDRSDPGFFVDPVVGISWTVVVPLASLLAVATGWLAWRARRARQAEQVTGGEAMVGQLAVALAGFGAEGGDVRFQGERWRAVTPSGGAVAPGDRVRVVAVEGLTLVVEPAQKRGG